MKNYELSVLRLYDPEEEYAQLFTEFLKKREGLPWEVHTYTSVEEIVKETRQNRTAVLVVAETAFSEELAKLQAGCTVILNESGVVKWPEFRNVNKYQKAENILQELLEAYLEFAEITFPRLTETGKAKLVGIYSPVRRCLQTSFALTMSQMLAEEYTTLYLNFEHYAGITGLLPDMQTRDLADLLYFLNAQGQEFYLRMETLIRKRGQLDYVPPVKAGQNLLAVTSQEWQRLLQKIDESGKYQYIVLDLSESMQGLFDIMKKCMRIFTLTKNDRAAACKMLQYEQLLGMCQYEEILEKTSRIILPRFDRIPEEPEQYTRGALADYVRSILAEERRAGTWYIQS